MFSTKTYNFATHWPIFKIPMPAGSFFKHNHLCCLPNPLPVSARRARCVLRKASLVWGMEYGGEFKVRCRLALLSARRARRAETVKGFGRQQRRLCLKRGTSRHWNFKNRSMGCKVIRVLVENMKNCHFAIENVQVYAHIHHPSCPVLQFIQNHNRKSLV